MLAGVVATGLFILAGYGVSAYLALPLGITAVALVAYLLSEELSVEIPSSYGSRVD